MIGGENRTPSMKYGIVASGKIGANERQRWS